MPLYPMAQHTPELAASDQVTAQKVYHTPNVLAWEIKKIKLV